MSKRMYSIFNRSPTNKDTNFGFGGYFPSMVGVNLGAAEKSVVGSIFNRIAIDVSNNRFMHVKVDEQGFIEDIPDSPINRRLLYRPNINQSPSQFIRDIVLTLCTDGVCVVAVTFTNEDGEPEQIQVGTVQGWHANGVSARFFNNEKQSLDTVYIEKCKCAIIENPLYTVMNDHASGVKRLIQKLHQMDSYTAAATSGKINAFIGMDYDMSIEYGKERALKHISQIEEQAAQSKYGLIYHSNTDKITFPNKPIDIDVIEQVKYLEEQVFAELGLTRSVFTGEAKEDANRIYQAKTIEPFCKAIAEGLTYAFITEDMFASERILHTRSLFGGVTGAEIADMADKLKRNAIITGNEVRKELGLIKSDEASANMLSNPNMPMQDQPMGGIDGDQQGGSMDIFGQAQGSTMNLFNQINQNDTESQGSVSNIFK